MRDVPEGGEGRLEQENKVTDRGVLVNNLLDLMPCCHQCR